MDISKPLIAKTLIGIGAISTVSIGSYVLHNRSNSKTSNGKQQEQLAEEEHSEENLPDAIDVIDIDNLALGLTTSQGSLKWEVSESKTQDNKVIGSLIGKNEEVTWTCNIEGTISSGLESKESGIIEQLRTDLGIEINTKTIKTDKQFEFQKFLKNCIRHRETDPVNNTSNSTINLEEIDASGEKYKFKDSELQKLLKDTFLDKNLKTKLGVYFSDCSNYKTGCTLDESKLKNIKFLDKKDENGEWKVTNAGDAKIKIQEDITIDKYRIKFIFETTQDVTIQKDENKKIILPKDSNMEYEIVKEETGLFLKKLWDPKKLMQAASLFCEPTEQKICKLNSGDLINVYKDKNNYSMWSSLSSSVDLNFFEDISGYNQGIKFTVSTDVNLNKTDSTNQKGEGLKTLFGNKTYEIKSQPIDNNQEEFFLVEHSET